jgi:hypothetical protein
VNSASRGKMAMRPAPSSRPAAAKAKAGTRMVG